ncbi:hypothetical protein AOQ84DRAFT_148309 [Glonium stellatum]|uniref:Uncharacterized protein n=1 Tax=Glonium stellatum TaxID=574774 RepID=A0A8E2F976_9PEZI|nr:hypothetical protein AOQ84DRAFT_148309 [Glonium stellatum]
MIQFKCRRAFVPSHWRPARIASPADSGQVEGCLFPRKPSPISAKEERWRLSGLSGLDGLYGPCGLYGLGGGWTNMGRASGMLLDRRLLCSHSPGAAGRAPCLDRTCQIMGMTRRSQRPMALRIHRAGSIYPVAALFGVVCSTAARWLTGGLVWGSLGLKKRTNLEPFDGLAILG